MQNLGPVSPAFCGQDRAPGIAHLLSGMDTPTFKGNSAPGGCSSAGQVASASLET